MVRGDLRAVVPVWVCFQVEYEPAGSSGSGIEIDRQVVHRAGSEDMEGGTRFATAKFAVEQHQVKHDRGHATLACGSDLASAGEVGQDVVVPISLVAQRPH
ncbi:hypothetical protein V1Y59_19875 [Gordonia sp. PKS22-38]|uniref:Uncharacterized protein n=1 Tax=Gordonia prachuapensis TaxID=3115651 RepID=A0ABU7MZY7_9ACTN|nr:hypothetical protein [Gordonia sp. PKS22-38]